MEGGALHSSEPGGGGARTHGTKTKEDIFSHFMFYLLKYEKKQHNIFKSIINRFSRHAVSISDFGINIVI